MDTFVATCSQNLKLSDIIFVCPENFQWAALQQIENYCVQTCFAHALFTKSQGADMTER